MKKYETLTAGELRRLHGKKCIFETKINVICAGKISVDKSGSVHICHNNRNCPGGLVDDKLGYYYSCCIYGKDRPDNYSSNETYNWIEIDLKDLPDNNQIDEIKPGDLIGVSNESQEDADENFKDIINKYYYVGKSKYGMFVVENKNGITTSCEYISNKKQTKKKITLYLTDTQIEKLKNIIK